MARVGLNIGIRGLKETAKALDEYIDHLNDGLLRTITRTAIKMHRTAREEVPVDEARLRSSIRWTLNKEKLSARVGSNVEYAPYIEFGTDPHFPPFKPILEWVKRSDKFRNKSKSEQWAIADGIVLAIGARGTKPQPYLEPAFNQHRKEFQKRVELEVKKAEPKISKKPKRLK